MKKPDCTKYDGGEVPPCSAFLNNINPIIKDGKLIFRNENRLFFFINTSPKDSSSAGSPDSNIGIHSTYTNLQISLATFLVGLYIDQVESEIIEYDKNSELHSDPTANTFIHKAIKDAPKFNFDFIPTLSLVISSASAILPLYTYTINITNFNFFILFVLNRLEGNPAFFFGNNSFAEEISFNFTLADMDINFPE